MQKTFIPIFVVLVVSVSSLQAATFAKLVRFDAPNRVIVNLEGEERAMTLSDTATIDGIDEDWQRRLLKLLHREFAGRWVMIEERSSGFELYRSPDGEFINEWVVANGAARASNARFARSELRASVTGQGYWSTGNRISSAALTTGEYLGVADPAGRSEVSSARKTQPKPKRTGGKGTSKGRRKK